jgi:asparagine synthetase B (glutamine-hydrolysing)
VYDEDVCFKEGIVHHDHKLIPNSEKTPCRTAEDIGRHIEKVLSTIDLDHAAVLLSGGMDSAILASYMPKGSKAYTARCIGNGAVDETEMAAKYCKLYGLEHVIVDVTWDDYKELMDELMLHDGSPIIPNEPQAYKLAKLAKQNGATCIVYGDCADLEFGGMDKLLSVDWDYDGFVERFTFADPKKILKNPADVSQVYDQYRIGENGIDYIKFLAEPYAVSAAGALTNAFKCAGLTYVDPYEKSKMAEPLDLERVRNGEPKYLIRELFKLRYPTLDIPWKLPMSRPATDWMKDWDGPKRPEFIPGCVEGMTGEQKLLTYSLERFLNLIEG